MRLAALLLAAAAASCSPPAPGRQPPEAPAARGALQACRVGPDGAAPVVGGLRTADRGIGGTGIVAVITGFASVCLAGQEIALGTETPVRIEERPAAADALRAGQVALVDAAGAS